MNNILFWSDILANGVVFEHHIHWQKTVLTSCLLRWGYFQILDTTFLHLLFTRVKSIIASASPPNLNVISWLFLFWKQVYIFMKCNPLLIAQLNYLMIAPSFILPIPKHTPVNLSKTTHITTNMVIKVSAHKHLTCHNLSH